MTLNAKCRKKLTAYRPASHFLKLMAHQLASMKSLRRQSTSLVTPHYYNLKILKLNDLYQFKRAKVSNLLATNYLVVTVITLRTLLILIFTPSINSLEITYIYFALRFESCSSMLLLNFEIIFHMILNNYLLPSSKLLTKICF